MIESYLFKIYFMKPEFSATEEKMICILCVTIYLLRKKGKQKTNK